MYREVKTIRLESRRLTRSKLASISSVLDAFNASVNFLIQQAVRNPAFQKISRGGMRYFAYPFPKVRKTFYCAWKARFRPLHTHYCHSAARIASEIRTSWSTWQRKARAVVDCPVYKKRRARLEAVLCRFDGRNIILVTGPRQHIFVPMAMYQHALKIITMFGIENCGEITISLDERARKLVAYLPFSRDVEATEPCSFVPIDINERSIDHAVVTENALGLGSIDTSEVSTVHYTYSLKRRRIQESIDTSTPYRVKKRKELLAKYGRRERNKTKELLHGVTTRMVAAIEPERPVVVMENLGDIRKASSRQKNLRPWQPLKTRGARRRLNRWNFGMFQQLVTCKVNATGNAVVKVSARNTSRKCIKCGKNTTCRSATFTCQQCGFSMNRHLLAAINILDKYLVDIDKIKSKHQDVASAVPAESDRMKSVAGAFRERVESIGGDRKNVITRVDMLLKVMAF
jgi:putative transposase